MSSRSLKSMRLGVSWLKKTHNKFARTRVSRPEVESSIETALYMYEYTEDKVILFFIKKC